MSSSKDMTFYNSQPVRCVSLLLSARPRGDELKLKVLVVCLDKQKVLKPGKLFLQFENNRRNAEVIKPAALVWVKHLSTSVPYSELAKAELHTKVLLGYEGEQGQGFLKPIRFSVLYPSRGGGRAAKAVKILGALKSTVYVRQSINNELYITNRQILPTDSKAQRRKLSLAYLVSKLPLRPKVLLYEKEAQKYEESAAVLFEELIDRGYTQARFIIDFDSPQYKLVPDKYKKYLLKKYSFGHYLNFFKAQTFLGTELPPHSLEVRCAHKQVARKLSDSSLKYVFLQHGVMYAVALESKDRRSSHRKRVTPYTFMRTVVSSKIEAQHFIDQAGYPESDLYITGLPKFDRSIKKDAADKITIMPTWRPWEFTGMRLNASSTNYYKMIEEMIAAVPPELQSKIHLLPHPLFMANLRDSPLTDYIKPHNSYDQVLQETKLLITDYSSIAYDAFYRGSNVVFWWKEKDYCMEHYGGRLMINENNIFGDIAYSKSQLRQFVEENYSGSQTKKHLASFNEIVTFSDGQNTSRLINCLVKDGIIRGNPS